jgi:hypothetical protein
VELKPAPGDRRRLVVLCCILAALGIAAPIVWATRKHSHRLTGKTEQGHRLKLMLDGDDRVIGLETRIDALCRGGQHWRPSWKPGKGWAKFAQHGERVRIRELRTEPAGNGQTRRVCARLVGRVKDGYAEGTVRLVARFYRGGTEVQACESGLQRWAAGIAANRRLAAAPPVRPLGGRYYPEVPSLAGKVSAERKHFIELTDRTCLSSHLAVLAARTYPEYVEAHSAQLRALEALGAPPDGIRLHRRWLGSFRTRVRLERRSVALAAAGRHEEARATWERLGPLKSEGNRYGQRFGLQVCTSNGPDRSTTRR